MNSLREVADPRQQEICGLYGQTALVLGGPGCGKTHVLARRIIKANAEYGVGFDDMLCVTFTNRAAREMEERVRGLAGYVPEGLFTGNLHRFCMRFLLVNGLVESETGIMDDDDLTEYLASTFGITHPADAANFRKVAARVYQDEHDFPERLKQRLRFPLGERELECIREYAAYKRHNMLIDFDEMILRTYDALRSEGSERLEMGAYRWLQIDEVQDMTPLQLAVTDRLMANADGVVTCVYLGDEQQAIFSFLGSGGTALDEVKRRCGGKVYSFRRNYRSPERLVALSNELAAVWMDVDAAHTPQATAHGEAEAKLITTHDRLLTTTALVRRLRHEHAGESAAVLTHTNHQAQEVSEALAAEGIEHIRLSRNDMFKQGAFKAMFAHVAVVVNPFRAGEWARLLYTAGALRTLKSARRSTAGMLERGMCPSELLSPGKESQLEVFCRLTDPGQGLTVAVIDTETTGLDIFADDIVQIAAVKLRGGEVVDDGGFEVFIKTERALPRECGKGVRNPLCELYDRNKALDPEDGLRRFAAYIADADAAAGHNLDFDLAMLRFNFRRRASAVSVPRVLTDEAPHIDTLQVSRLVMPRRRDHSLGGLRAHYGLTNAATHVASDDAAATAELVLALGPEAREKLPAIKALRTDERYLRTAHAFDEVYGAHYRRAKRLLADERIGPDNTLEAEMSRVYEAFAASGLIRRIEHYAYFRRLVNEVAVNAAREPRFREQAMLRAGELLTFSESDLFPAGIVRENVAVMTIHKSKGLEHDNVIVYNADAARGSIDERAKVYYVAFSRARKRLFALTSGRPDPVVDAVRNMFDEETH